MHGECILVFYKLFCGIQEVIIKRIWKYDRALQKFPDDAVAFLLRSLRNETFLRLIHKVVIRVSISSNYKYLVREINK